MPLIDYQNLIDNKVRDDAGVISPADRDQALSSAVIRYSSDHPAQSVEDIVAVAGQFINLPVGWQPTFSQLKSIEYPIGDVPPSYLLAATYGIYNAPGIDKIMLDHSFAGGESVRLTYSTKQIVDAVTDTPADEHKEAIASWAAALLCEQLASYYSGDSDSLIQADSVDHAGKARDFAGRARTLRKFYLDTLGIDPKKNTAAGVVVDMDLKNSLGNNRLTHSNRYR